MLPGGGTGIYILPNSWPNGPGGNYQLLKKWGEKSRMKKEEKKGREREKEGKKKEKEGKKKEKEEKRKKKREKRKKEWDKRKKKRGKVKEKKVYLYEMTLKKNETLFPLFNLQSKR